jgi:hypothetical protein
MTDGAQKILLGENHRLAVSVVVRGTERACESMLETLDRGPSQMNELRNDILPEERTKLRELATALQEEIHRLAGKVELEKSRTSRRRAIAAVLSAALIDLQETQDSGLKGYGEISAEAKRTLDEGFGRMMKLLEKMLAIAERR